MDKPQPPPLPLIDVSLGCALVEMHVPGMYSAIINMVNDAARDDFGMSREEVHLPNVVVAGRIFQVRMKLEVVELLGTTEKEFKQ